jgi:hypothetical protein
MDRNLWATVAYTGWVTESTANTINSSPFYWNYYQWWRSNTWFTISNNPWYTWTEWNQWPCPTWYHVPTVLEWNWLVKTWFAYKWASCDVSIWTTCSWTWNATLANFKNDLKLPFVGLRAQSDGSVRYQGLDGYYWSSSPDDSAARYLEFRSSYIRQFSSYRGIGISVRCFKN